MDWIQPMEPVLSEKIIDKEGWIHQIKWDGIRGLCYINRENLKIFTKKGYERTAFYPELHELIALFKGSQAIIDGEMIVLDHNGNPSFYQSLIRERVRTESKILHYARKHPIKYIVFDILYLNDSDVRMHSLANRRDLLMEHLKKSANITITDDFHHGESLYQLMKDKHWEGIVSKNIHSPYISGKKHTAWYKTKIKKKLLAVVAGLQWNNDTPNSLVLGVYHEGRLYFIGKASLGLKQRDFQLLKEYSNELKCQSSPFTDVDKLPGVTWLKPALTCWVNFSEWTEGGQLRHPKITGFHGHKPHEADGKEYTE